MENLKRGVVNVEETMGEDIEFEPRKCRICGCTDCTACIDGETGMPCYWAEPDLCSVCEKKGSPAKIQIPAGPAGGWNL